VLFVVRLKSRTVFFVLILLDYINQERILKNISKLDALAGALFLSTNFFAAAGDNKIR